MRRFLVFSSLTIVLTVLCANVSWSQTTNDTLPINVLVRNVIQENGGKTNMLPLFQGSKTAFREIKKDAEGAQVFFSGDQVSPLLTMFKSVYGEPVYVRTNSSGMTMFQYTKKSVGVGLNCFESTSAAETTTHLIILGSKGLESLQGASPKDDEHDQRISADERHACEIAIKAAVDHGFKGEFEGIAVHGTVGWVVKVFEKSKGPIRGSVATVGLKNDFKVVHFEGSEKPSK